MSDGLKGHVHHWYAGDSNTATIWWYCAGCDGQMTTSKALTPDRLREAAETMEAFWQSTGREYDPDVLREEASQIESEPPFSGPYPENVECVCGDLIHPDMPSVVVQADRSLWHGNADGGGHRHDAQLT